MSHNFTGVELFTRLYTSPGENRDGVVLPLFVFARTPCGMRDVKANLAGCLHGNMAGEKKASGTV